MKPCALVQVWCEIDPSLNVRIDRQSGVPLAADGDQLLRVSPLGRSGIATARETLVEETTAFALGEGHEAALRHALAAGAQRAVQINLTASALDTTGIGSLAEWVAAEKPSLVIADRLAGPLASRLGWAHLAGVDALRIETGRLHAIRHLGRGDREWVTARLPAVARLHAESLRPGYVARARIARVDDSRIERVTLAAPGEHPANAEIGALQPVRPRTRLGGAMAAAPVKAMDRLNALMGLGQAGKSAATKPAGPSARTPSAMAEEFVRYLAHHDLLG